MKLITRILLSIVFFSICLSSSGQSSDTTCIPNDRLGRIADSLSYHKHEHERYKGLYLLQRGSIQILEETDSLYRVTFRETNKQLGACRDAYLLEVENSKQWKNQAKENESKLKEQVFETNRQFKRKNTFKGLFWGTLGAGIISTTVLLLNN